MAVQNSNSDIIKEFLGNSELDINFISRYKEIYRKKIKEQTPLYIAVKNKNAEFVQLLFKDDRLDANIPSVITFNGQIKKKTYSLHCAVLKENMDIIKLLMSVKTIDANLKDEQGRKPIEYASNEEIKQILNQS